MVSKRDKSEQSASKNDGDSDSRKDEGTKLSSAVAPTESKLPKEAAFKMPDFSKKRLVKPNNLSEPLPAHLHAKLTDFYRPYNAQLEQLLGRSLGYPK